MTAARIITPASAAIFIIPPRSERDDLHAIGALLKREPLAEFPEVDSVHVGQGMAPDDPVELYMYSLSGRIPATALECARELVRDATGLEATVATFGLPNGSP